MWPTCGTATVDVAELSSGSSIAIGSDGTMFHENYVGGEQYVSRHRPGLAAERTWVHVGPASTGVAAIAVDASGTAYALLQLAGDHTQLVRLTGGATGYQPIGPAVQTTSGPTGLAFAPDGLLFEASFTGLQRVDLATGQRTSVSAPLMLREVYFVGMRAARGVTYDHGLVEISLDPDATASTYTTIFPFTTLALQFTGLDDMGRTYALIHEMSNDKLVRFDPSFTTRETLAAYPTSSMVFDRLAFGRSALRCDVLITGFELGRVVSGDTPGVP
jgi:hypothetical protein